MTNKIPEPKDLPCPEGYWWHAVGRMYYLYRADLLINIRATNKLVFCVAVKAHDTFEVRETARPGVKDHMLYSLEMLRREVENACARERLLR